MRQKRIWILARAATGAILFPFLLAPATSFAAEGSLRSVRVGVELPVTPMDNSAALAHNSPVVAADPNDERVVSLASRMDNPEFGCSLHISGDRGQTWLPAPVIPRLPEGAEKCYGPEIAFDREGRLNYLFLGLSGLGNNPVGAYLVQATDGGYSKPVRVLGPERYMVRMAIDRTIGANGRIHLIWLEAGADPPLGGLALADNPIMASYSDDGGRTFSKPVRVSDRGRRLSVAPALVLGKDHSVHVVYYDLQEDLRDYQGLEGPVWEGKWSLVLSTSTDGGKTFSPGSEIDRSIAPPERVMLIYTMPPAALAAGPDGTMLAAWHDGRNGDWDVFYSRSTDGGKVWSAPERLNDDPLKNGRHQHMPRLSFSLEGRIDAIFYDRRDDPNNQKAHVFFSSSPDGAKTWSANRRLTREPSDTMIGPRYPIPSARNLVEFGSRIGLMSRADGALAAWTDTRNSLSDSFEQEVYAAPVQLSGGDQSSAWLIGSVIAGIGALILILLLGARRAAGARQLQRADG